MRKFMFSIIFVIVVISFISGDSKPQTKYEIWRKEAADLPKSFREKLEEYINKDAEFNLKIEYIKQMSDYKP